MRRELLEIADALRALATTGLHFTDGPFDRERYVRVGELARRLAELASEREPGALTEVYGADTGYVTPKLDVRLALFRRDRILLVRERSDGRWAMPGGYVDVGDSPADAAVRETLEEAGLHARVRRLVGIFDRRLDPASPPSIFHIVKLVFLGELRDPEARPRAGSEALEADFHPLERLPELSLGRTLPLHIREALRVRDDPAAAPWLD